MLSSKMIHRAPAVACASTPSSHPKPVPSRMPATQLREHADEWAKQARDRELKGLACIGAAATAQAAQYVIIGKYVYDNVQEIPMRTAFLSRREAFIELGKYLGPILGVMAAQAVVTHDLRKKANVYGAQAAMYRNMERDVREELDNDAKAGQTPST